MRRLASAVAFLTVSPGLAFAVGLDRSGQTVTPLFEDGNYLELSFGRIMPDLSGTDLAVFGGRDSGNVGNDYTQIRGALKYQLTDQLSMALIVDRPYGIDISYPEDSSVALGGTRAEVDTAALTAIARYEVSDAFSVHGGLRYQELTAAVGLRGAAYGGISGYNVDFDKDGKFGYLLGAAYERPDIALRVALTYVSEIEHKLSTSETLNGVPVNLIDPRLAARSTTSIITPASWNLDFQSGIAPETLVFGRIRYAGYADTIVSPVFFDAALPGDRDSLTDIEDKTEYSLGVGRRFGSTLSGSVTIAYEPKNEDDLVSPLSPFDGRYSASIGLGYDLSDDFTVFSGLSYTWLRDARPETGTPDTPRAEFADNNSFAVGVRIGYKF